MGPESSQLLKLGWPRACGYRGAALRGEIVGSGLREHADRFDLACEIARRGKRRAMKIAPVSSRSIRSTKRRSADASCG
ncbi:MAG: hypothetical protein KGN02_02020 [bacterium]|nr:hypothetical protein [bacterium]